MPPRKKLAGAAKTAADRKAAANNTPPASNNDTTANELPSPTESVGPTWDTPLRTLPGAVRNTIDSGPPPALNSTPINFDNPVNWCYRNALMTIMIMEYSDLRYQDHILQAFNNVAKAYHSTGSTRVKDTEGAMSVLWQLFRGGFPGVQLFQGALPEPEDAQQEDPAKLLLHMLFQIQRQLHDGLLIDQDESLNVFEAMQILSYTNRTRCPGTQDKLCVNPNEKQRRTLDDFSILSIKIPDGDNITLRDCIGQMLRQRDTRWCDKCIGKKYDKDVASAEREDRAWRNIRDCPEVLFMQLQRNTTVRDKKGATTIVEVKKPVAIPEILDISEFLEYHSHGEGSIVRYELRGVASHIERNMYKGHYVAHVKESQKWWRVDDKGTP